MCYSTYINKSLRDIARDYDADIDWEAFILLYRQRLMALQAGDEAVKPYSAIKIHEAMDRQLLENGGPGAAEIQDLRWQYFVTTMEQLKAKRTKILHGLQDLRELQAKKATKGRADKIGVEERKITKIDAASEKTSKEVDAIKSGHSVEHDGYRVFPGMFAPVVLQRGSKRVVVPMRFEVLPASGVDIKHDLYNARRDSLYPENKTKQMWKPLFGKTHAIISFTRFFESVELPNGESTEIVVHPKGFERMHAACLFAEYDHEDYGIFRSFAICTDDPPREIELAGHDRAPIFIAYDAVHEWLNPAGQTLAELDALFDRKEPVVYEWKFMDPELEKERDK